MDHLIQLTGWPEREEVLLDPRAVVSMQRLPTSQSDITGQELGERTSIGITNGNYFVVYETPGEIRYLASAKTAG